MTIGQHINLIRNRRGMTLDQLAKLSGVSKNTLISWIYHDKNPNIEPLIKVANALNVSLDELVGREWSADAVPQSEVDILKITKRNNRYFLYVNDNSLSMIPIKACPICGRSFEAKENINGEWLDNDDVYTADMLHYRCSICGNYEYTREKFCSRCGAKMKGGVE